MEEPDEVETVFFMGTKNVASVCVCECVNIALYFTS